MNLIRKGHGHAHRGIIGVESAIVMIAFVIVAAALAFEPNDALFLRHVKSLSRGSVCDLQEG